ncbi:hypothetical protein GID45_08815 [Salmonella enterica]|nr:hypothetical protein [Salmonella enterica]HAG1868208.1 hypothetical protein [Salmonella enterica]
MECSVSDLVKRGHEQAAELKSSCGAIDVRSMAQLISDLATQLEVQFVRSTNMAVQLANAESKCRELAAENAGLKKSEVEFNEYCRHECEDVGDTWVDDFTETPATDAFLAEVRAQGVEMFSEKFGGGTPLSNLVKEVAADFAAKLRKGVAQ